MSLSLIEAFGKFGSKPSSRVNAFSAIAADGAVVLNCSAAYFVHPAQGVLRYEDRLSREAAATRGIELLSQHLTLARDAALPVRMVVSTIAKQKSRSRSYHVRADLIGKLVEFDGDHFMVDFTRRDEPQERATGVGARRRK